jgi:hypothetical protein
MNKNAVICAIEYALRDEGCNEVPVAMVYNAVKKTTGNLGLSMDDFMVVLRELEADGLFEWSGTTDGLTEDSLIARSQEHPSVPRNDGSVIYL